MAEQDYFKKTVIMLKQILDDRGLSKVGKKAELVARLEEADAAKPEVTAEPQTSAAEEASLPVDTHSPAQSETQEKSDHKEIEDLPSAPHISTQSVPSSEKAKLPPEQSAVIEQVGEAKNVGDKGSTTNHDEQRDVKDNDLTDEAMHSAPKQKEDTAESGVDVDVSSEPTMEAVDPMDGTGIDLVKVESTKLEDASHDATNQAGTEGLQKDSGKIHRVTPTQVSSDVQPTLTEALISEILTPDKSATWQDPDDKPFDTAVGPSVPMALNVMPSKPTVVGPGSSQIEANDPELLKRKRETDESAVQNEAAKRAKQISDQGPIGGSSLLKEEVPAYQEQLHQSSASHRAQRKPALDGSQVPASLHAATEGLYITGLTRPINNDAFSEHLQSICGEIPISLYLDSIKSHAFVVFSNDRVASSVRLGLHGQIWPNEPQRKALWVDFLPLASIQEFMKREEQAARGSRWEVIYPESDGNVRAFLQEVGTDPSRSSAIESKSQPQESDQQSSRPSKKIIRLDDLFKKTAAKPVLYYVPAKPQIVEKRLQKLEAEK